MEEGALVPGGARLLQPTSGSSGGTKFIPYGSLLAKQFAAAIDPWIAGTFLDEPLAMAGKAYWSVSPSTDPDPNVVREFFDGNPRIPVGFGEDTDYLSPLARLFGKMVMAVPSRVSKLRPHDLWLDETLAYLAGSRDLALISVWSPTFLLSLLEALTRDICRTALLIARGRPPYRPKDPARAAEIVKAARKCRIEIITPWEKRAAGRPFDWSVSVAAAFFETLWPGLKVISTWCDGSSAGPASVLRQFFPTVKIQSKGLAATEGIVTIPVPGHGKVLAYRSHFFEFIEPSGNRPLFAWELRKGCEYEVVMTTAGGLYRYRLGDRVRVSGRFGSVPCLDFIGRTGIRADLAGEKLEEEFVSSRLFDSLGRAGIDPGFAMIAPMTGRCGYGLFISPRCQMSSEAVSRLESDLDEGLSRNFHYAHARAIGQLEQIRVLIVSREINPWKIHAERMATLKRTRTGNIKLAVLETQDGWEEYLLKPY